MSIIHNNYLCQLCQLCNCNNCKVNRRFNESSNIFEILNTFLTESNDTDFMNISVNDNIEKVQEETSIKDTNNYDEEPIIENSSPSTTVGSCVLINTTAVKMITETVEDMEPEHIVKIKLSK